MDKITHVAWDQGVIDRSFDQVFGSHLVQKSSKTMCGIRVSLAFIDNHQATCDRCRLIVVDLQNDLEILRDNSRSMLSRIKMEMGK